MADSVERVRNTPGDVLCPALISYRAGKPFVIDKFNAKERMSAGAFRGCRNRACRRRDANIDKTDLRADGQSHSTQPVTQQNSRSGMSGLETGHVRNGEGQAYRTETR